MEHFKPAFDILISQVRRTGSFYMTFFVLFLYQVVFDEHLKCACKHDIITTDMLIFYMVFPALILFFLTLWMDEQLQRLLRITCRRSCQCTLCRRLVRIFMKAVTIGLLWVVSVLIDGDWYVCYHRTELQCRNNTNTTTYLEEQETQNETHIKWKSKINGAQLLLFLLAGNFFLTAIPWRNSCCRCCSKPHYRALFEENIWEETEIHIEKVLKKTAQECIVHYSKERLPHLLNARGWPTTTTITTNRGDMPTITIIATKEGGDSITTTITTKEGGGKPTIFTNNAQGEEVPTKTTINTEGGEGGPIFTTTTQGGVRSTTITITTQGGGEPTITTINTQGGEATTITTTTTQVEGMTTTITITTQGGGEPTITTITKQEGGGATITTTTTQELGEPKTITITTQGGDEQTVTTTNTLGEGKTIITTNKIQGGVWPTITTITTQGESGSTMESEIIRLKKFDFDKISDLYSNLNQYIFPAIDNAVV